MQIHLNDEIFFVSSPDGEDDIQDHIQGRKLIFLSDLIKQLALKDTRGFALALNSAVISKQDWPTTSLSEGDHVILIRATQGG